TRQRTVRDRRGQILNGDDTATKNQIAADVVLGQQAFTPAQIANGEAPQAVDVPARTVKAIVEISAHAAAQIAKRFPKPQMLPQAEQTKIAKHKSAVEARIVGAFDRLSEGICTVQLERASECFAFEIIEDRLFAIGKLPVEPIRGNTLDTQIT